MVATRAAELLFDLVAMVPDVLPIDAPYWSSCDVAIDQGADHRPVGDLRSRLSPLPEIVVRHELPGDPTERSNWKWQANRPAISARRQRSAPFGDRQEPFVFPQKFRRPFCVGQTRTFCLRVAKIKIFFPVCYLPLDVAQLVRRR
jgi:hypothetical protein